MTREAHRGRRREGAHHRFHSASSSSRAALRCALVCVCVRVRARLLLLLLCVWVTVTLSQRLEVVGVERDARMQRFACGNWEARKIFACGGESQKSSSERAFGLTFFRARLSRQTRLNFQKKNLKKEDSLIKKVSAALFSLSLSTFKRANLKRDAHASKS